jgi:hypothetical protein
MTVMIESDNEHQQCQIGIMAVMVIMMNCERIKLQCHAPLQQEAVHSR